MKRHFKSQIAYNNWANERVLESLEDQQVTEPKILEIYGHMVSSQIIWLLRIKGLPTSPFPLWENYNKVELRSMTEESSRNWINYLEEHKFDTFEEMISYVNSKEITYESTIREIVSHMLLHSAYHRGQIAVLLRERGLVPPVTDHIAYSRL